MTLSTRFKKFFCSSSGFQFFGFKKTRGEPNQVKSVRIFFDDAVPCYIWHLSLLNVQIIE